MVQKKKDWSSKIHAAIATLVIVLLFSLFFQVEPIDLNQKNSKDRYPSVRIYDLSEQPDSEMNFWFEFSDPRIFYDRSHPLGFNWSDLAAVPRQYQAVTYTKTRLANSYPFGWRPLNERTPVDDLPNRLVNTYPGTLAKFDETPSSLSPKIERILWLNEQGQILTPEPELSAIDLSLLKSKQSEVNRPTVLEIFPSQICRIQVIESCGVHALDLVAVKKLRRHFRIPPKAVESFYISVEWRLWRSE